MRKLYITIIAVVISSAGYASAYIGSTPPGTPVFDPIAPLCECAPAPVLPTTSANGYSGTWSPATIDPCLVGTFVYTFTPDTGQDALPVSLTITVNPAPQAPAAMSVQYCQNAVAQPLTATGQNLLWYANGTGGIGSPIAPTPNTSLPGAYTYYVSQTVNGCEGPRATSFVIIDTIMPLNLACATPSLPASVVFDWSNVPNATGYTISYSIDNGPAVTQTQSSPSNFTVTGLSAGQSVMMTVTTIGAACQATATVTCATLGNETFSRNGFEISPNPVRDVVFFSGVKSETTVQIFNMLGLLVATERISREYDSISVSRFPAGMYLVQLESEAAAETFRIVKQD